MASLTKRLEVFRVIISRIVIEVGGRQNYVRRADDNVLINQLNEAQNPSSPIAISAFPHPTTARRPNAESHGHGGDRIPRTGLWLV